MGCLARPLEHIVLIVRFKPGEGPTYCENRWIICSSSPPCPLSNDWPQSTQLNFQTSLPLRCCQFQSETRHCWKLSLPFLDIIDHLDLLCYGSSYEYYYYLLKVSPKCLNISYFHLGQGSYPELSSALATLLAK